MPQCVGTCFAICRFRPLPQSPLGYLRNAGRTWSIGSWNEEGAQTLVIIDGQLLGDYVLAAENYCSLALASGKTISIVLQDVSVIDDGARNMLRGLVRRGVRLHGTGLYTSHIVKVLQEGVDALRRSRSALRGRAIAD